MPATLFLFIFVLFKRMRWEIVERHREKRMCYEEEKEKKKEEEAQVVRLPPSRGLHLAGAGGART